MGMQKQRISSACSTPGCSLSVVGNNVWFLHTPGSVFFAGSLAQERNDLCARASALFYAFSSWVVNPFMTVFFHTCEVSEADAVVARPY